MIRYVAWQRLLVGGLVQMVSFLLVTSSGTSLAHATTFGAITGTMKFQLQAGNFCPSSRNCTDAMYTQTAFAGVDQFSTNVPIRNAIVYAEDGPGNVLGIGGTDNSGFYNVSWVSDNDALPVRMKVVTDHAESRFRLRNSSGGQATFTVGASGVSGATVSNGTATFGADPFLNSYWAGELVWRLSLAFSPRMVANFNSLSIRAFADNIPGFMPKACPASCAWGEANRIQLDVSAGFAPQSRIMHEMGHIANYMEKTYKMAPTSTTFGGYCWNSPIYSAACTWVYNNGEWGMTAFEEGWATFLADSTLYFPNSPPPHSCLTSQTSCPNGSFNIEASSGAISLNNCGNAAPPVGPENRWPLTTMRFLWDVYDAVNDSETLSEGFSNYARLLDVMNLYPTGVAANANNSPWDAFLANVVNPDRRGSIAYRDNYSTNVGVSLATPWVTNCGPW